MWLVASILHSMDIKRFHDHRKFYRTALVGARKGQNKESPEHWGLEKWSNGFLLEVVVELCRLAAEEVQGKQAALQGKQIYKWRDRPNGLRLEEILEGRLLGFPNNFWNSLDVIVFLQLYLGLCLSEMMRVLFHCLCRGCFYLLSVYSVPTRKNLSLLDPKPSMLCWPLKWDRATCGTLILESQLPNGRMEELGVTGATMELWAQPL